jgi:hypothetical protein
MDDDPYSPRAPLGGILRAWFVVSFCAVLLGCVYPFGMKYLPFLWLNIAQIVLFGIAVGACAERASRGAKIRVKAVVVLLAAYAACLGLYVAWAVDPLARLDEGFVAWHPRMWFAYMQFLYEHGAWELEGEQENLVGRGGVLLAWWAAELAIAVGTATTTALGYRGKWDAPFCGQCNQWANIESAVVELKPTSNDESSLERLAEGNLSVLDDFELASDEDATCVWLDLTTCPRCDRFNFLTVRLAQRTVDPDGNVDIASHELLSNVRINAAQLERIREKRRTVNKDRLEGPLGSDEEGPPNPDDHESDP